MAALPQFVELNKDGDESILFIHSLGSTSNEWRGTVQCLLEETKKYHILLPTLHIHELSNAAKCIAVLSNLIREKAKNGVAHVVGLSIGAHIAVLLAQVNTCLLQSLCVSGYYSLSMYKRLLLPYVLCCIKRVDIHKSATKTFSLLESRNIAELLLMDYPGDTHLKTTIVGATRFGESELRAARKLKDRLGGGPNVQILEGCGLQHRWNVPRPDLFAKLVLSVASGKRTYDHLPSKDMVAFKPDIV